MWFVRDITETLRGAIKLNCGVAFVFMGDEGERRGWIMTGAVQVNHFHWTAVQRQATDSEEKLNSGCNQLEDFSCLSVVKLSNSLQPVETVLTVTVTIWHTCYCTLHHTNSELIFQWTIVCCSLITVLMSFLVDMDFSISVLLTVTRTVSTSFIRSLNRKFSCFSLMELNTVLLAH